MRTKNEKLRAELASAFNIGLSAPAETVFSAAASDLLSVERMKILLEAHMPLIRTASPDASAISVAIGVGNLAFAQQYAISTYGTSLDLSLDNLTLHVYMQDGYEAFGYTLRHWEEREYSNPGGRDAWRAETLSVTYRETLAPLIAAAGQAGAIRPRELWGQFPSNLRYYLGVWKEAAESEHAREAIEADYAFLREGLDSSAFGGVANPYREEPIWTEDLEKPGVMIPLKNTCCLYYKWEDGSYCFACPRLKESERAARRAECRGASAEPGERL